MIIKHTFFWTILVLFLAAPGVADAQIKLTWEVLKYDVSVDLPSDMAAVREADITASLDLRNQSNSSFDRVSLRISDKAKVSEITSGGSKIDFSSSGEKVTESQRLQLLRLNVPPVAAGSSLRVTLKYKLTVESNSGLSALSPVNSQFLPLSFWYPTPTSWFFSEGGDYSPFDLSIQGPGARDIVSAGSVEGTKVSNPLKGMPFFATGKWRKSEHDGVVVYAPESRHVAAGRAAEMAKLANEAKAFAEKALGAKFSVPLKIVGVARGAGFSDSGVIFVERGAFSAKSLDSKTTGAISEAIVKTILGNVIEVRGAGYGVIREGLSRFVSNRFLEEKFGAGIAEIVRLRQISNYSAIVDRDSPLSFVSPVDGYFYSANGNKGSMIWRYLDKTVGADFMEIVRSESEDGNLTLSEIRNSFAGHKEFLDYSFDKITTLNLMIGNPVSGTGHTRAALRNFGEFSANVRVVGYDGTGKEYSQNIVIPANDFAEARFETPAKIVRVEVDPEKLYVQTSYIDDVAPREIDDNDPLVYIKKEFDRQKFDEAATNAKAVLARYPELDEARVFLARSYLASNKITDAKLEFERVLNSKLPSPQSLAWALFGLGEAARKTGQPSVARTFYDEAIWSDADYGASLAARRARSALVTGAAVPGDVASFFAGFDKAVIANSKREVEAYILSGEISRFASNVAGQAQEWQTRVVAIDDVDDENIFVETALTLKLLNREVETGLAVFRLSRVDGKLLLSGVDVFEVS